MVYDSRSLWLQLVRVFMLYILCLRGCGFDYQLLLQYYACVRRELQHRMLPVLLVGLQLLYLGLSVRLANLEMNSGVEALPPLRIFVLTTGVLTATKQAFGIFSAKLERTAPPGNRADARRVCCRTPVNYPSRAIANWPQDSSRSLDWVGIQGYAFVIARVAELADALALGASALGRAGSNPALRS